MSSVTLKSPIVKSGIGMCAHLLSVVIVAQKLGCSFHSFSAYIFRTMVVHFSSHLIFSIIALPGINTHVTTLSGLISFLLMTNATSPLVHGLVGCSDTIICRFFLNLVCSWVIMFWSR